MIVVRIELWPKGDESRKVDLGTCRITNDGSEKQNAEAGNYSVVLTKGRLYSKNLGIWRTGHVFDFPRKRLGPWDLLLRALQATVGSRK